MMKSRFRMKDIGQLSMFVGMEIDIQRESKVIMLTQTLYCEKILEEFGMKDCDSASTPMESKLKLKDSKETMENEVVDRPYRKLIGSLLYLSTHTRPDIAEAVGNLSRNLEKPTIEHWNAGMRLLKYLKGTANYGIKFEGNDLSLIGYSDSSWASTQDRKSVSGYVFMINNAPVSWRSKKQTIVALSSTEAEYVALSEAAKESVWIKKLFVELKILHQENAVLIYEDNQSCIKLTKNDSNHGRMKHVDIKYHFVKDQVEKGEVAVKYCKTEEMIADILTKSLGKAQFVYLRNLMGVYGEKVCDQERVLKGDLTFGRLVGGAGGETMEQ